MTIGNHGSDYVEKLKTQSKGETKIVMETQSESVIKNERAIVPKVHSELLLRKSCDYYTDDSISDKKSIPTMVTTTAQIPGEIALEFDKVVIVAVGKVKGKRKEKASETVNRPQDGCVKSIGPSKRSPFSRDLQVYCAGGRRPCCMDCSVRFEYCYMGPKRNQFIAYMMLYYFVMQTGTFFMYQVLTRLVMVLINYIMMCLACGNHCLLSFLLLLVTVVAYSHLLAALSSRFDTDLFWFANTSMGLLALFMILLAFTMYDFTNCRLRAYVVLVSLLSFYLVFYLARDCTKLTLFQKQYSQRQLTLYGFMTILHGLVLVTTIRRILCCCFIELGVCDYAIAAYLLYTMWLQQVLCLLHMGSPRDN